LSYEPVGTVEIGNRLGVQRAIIDSWRWRGLLLEPTFIVGGQPAWAWAEIKCWTRETGRLPEGVR
jgi:hypothetical protein